MLKPTEPKIDAGGKSAKLTSGAKWRNWQNGKIGKMVEQVGRKQNGKMLKPTGPKIDADGKMVN